jgi:hypothetical protein
MEQELPSPEQNAKRAERSAERAEEALERATRVLAYLDKLWKPDRRARLRLQILKIFCR